MKATLFFSLLFLLFAADVYARPVLKPQPLLGELKDSQSVVLQQNSPQA